VLRQNDPDLLDSEENLRQREERFVTKADDERISE